MLECFAGTLLEEERRDEDFQAELTSHIWTIEVMHSFSFPLELLLDRLSKREPFQIKVALSFLIGCVIQRLIKKEAFSDWGCCLLSD